MNNSNIKKINSGIIHIKQDIKRSIMNQAKPYRPTKLKKNPERQVQKLGPETPCFPSNWPCLSSSPFPKISPPTPLYQRNWLIPFDSIPQLV